MKTAKEYRMESKAALSGNWGMAILLCLLYALILGALSGTGILALLLGGAFSVGISFAFVNLYRRPGLKIEDLFHAFTNGDGFTATIGMGVKTAIFTFLWSLLFVIPGIVKSYSYAMAPYILMDHPELTGGEAIRASMKLMNGKKGRLFCLDLSYIGWLLLCVLTLGILALWIDPWMTAARAAFYESVKGDVVLD